jgi:hypothetical protein
MFSFKMDFILVKTYLYAGNKFININNLFTHLDERKINFINHH